MNNEVFRYLLRRPHRTPRPNLFSAPQKKVKEETEEKSTTKRQDEKHGLTLRGHMMACRCMTICTSTAKTKFTVHVGSAGERITSGVISLPSRK